MARPMFQGKKLWVALAGVFFAGALTIGAAYAKSANNAVPVDSPAFGQFLGPCSSDADCAGGNTCQSFKQLGLRCTHSCNADSECAAPSKGCSKQHRCSNATATGGHPRQ
jgi:hypothetical protein